MATVLVAEAIVSRDFFWFCSQGNPAVRVMRELGRLLRSFCADQHSSWVRYVKKIEYLMNVTTHESTGQSPWLILKKTAPSAPVEAVVSFLEAPCVRHEEVITKCPREIVSNCRIIEGSQE